jgi:phage terminase large subunit-like protein
MPVVILTRAKKRKAVVLDDAPGVEPSPETQQTPASSEAPGIESASELVRQMMYESCGYFAAEVLRGPPEAPYKGRFLIGEHHEEWSQALTERDRICIVAARDHGKTFFFNLAYPIWQAWRHPKTKGYIFSATQEQANRILGDIKEELETNPALQHLVPPQSQRKKWSTTSIRLANGSLIVAKGYGVKVRGAHPQWVVLDDVLNDEDAFSETTRRRHIEYFYSALVNLVNPADDPTRGQIICIGTPYHQADLYADLQRNEEFFSKIYPAIDKQGRPLWPERWSAKKLARRRREIGSIRFSREYLCRALSDESSLFPYRLFRGTCEVFTARLGMPIAWWKANGIDTVVMGVDFAISSSAGADWTVLFIIGVDKMGNHWILDIIRTQGLGYEQQRSLIHKHAKLYHCDLVFLESNQMQRIWGDELIRISDLPIKQVHTGADKHSLEKGIPALRVLFENGKVKIPRGDAESIEKTEGWIEEMFCHTFTDGEVVSIGEHNDRAMAFWIAEKAIREGLFSFSFGEEDGDEEAYDEMMNELAEEKQAWELDESLPDDDLFLPGPSGAATPRPVANLSIGFGDEEERAPPMNTYLPHLH